MKSLSRLVVLILSLLTLSCSKQGEPNSGENTQTTPQAKILKLDIESSLNDVEEQLLAATFELGANKATLQLDNQPMESIILITDPSRSQEYYTKIIWERTSKANQLKYKGSVTNLLTGQPLALSDGVWYMTGYVGGSFDASSKQVNYAPNTNSLQALSSGDKTNLAVPIYFPWTKLVVTSDGTASYAEAKEGSTKSSPVQFRTLGLLMRVSLKNNNNYSVRYNGIRYDSNVLATRKGYYSLKLTDQPVPTTQPNFVPTFTPSVTDEPLYSLSDNPTLSAGTEHSKTYLVWAAVQQSTESPLTHIFADAVRMNGGTALSTPGIRNIFIWGSNSMPKERTRILQRTTLLREKLALEYFDENYVTGTDTRINRSTRIYQDSVPRNDQTNAKTPTIGQIDRLSRYNLPSSDVELFNRALLTRNDFLTSAAQSKWQLPKVYDLNAWFASSDKTRGTGVNIEMLNTGQVKTVSNLPVRINGVLKNYTDVYKEGSILYAIRFDDGTSGRRQYTAWRYTTDNNTATTECIYLGPWYKGKIEQIANETFWQRNSTDIIRRTYRRTAAIEYMIVGTTGAGATTAMFDHVAPAIITAAPESSSDKTYLYLFPEATLKADGKDWGYATSLTNMTSLWFEDKFYESSKKNQGYESFSYLPIVLMHKTGIGWDN